MKYPNISNASKSAFRSLWSDVWHKIGREWPENHLPDKKFKNNIYNADPLSLETICKVVEDCGIKMIKRLDEGEIELIAPGADDFSIIMYQDNYDDSLDYEYSDLEGLTVREAINVLNASLCNEKVSFDYICIRFKTSSIFTGLRNKILRHPPQSTEFHDFISKAKSKLESTAEVLHNAIDMAEEPVRSKAQNERQIIAKGLDERYVMMRKRHAFFKEIVRPFNSFESFAEVKGDWFAILGIDIRRFEKYIELIINLDDGYNETYFIVIARDGNLTVSDIIRWHDDYCANSLLNIFTLKGADEDEILS